MCTFFVVKGRYIAMVTLVTVVVGMFAVFSCVADVHRDTQMEEGVFLPILMSYD